MKKQLLVVLNLCVMFAVSAQSLTSRLQKAFQAFENDAQMKSAIASLYVIDARSGAVVFARNSRIGLAPASTQKIITSVTAFELLGPEYSFTTEFAMSSSAPANLLIIAGGDPTFGSWRWEKTKIQSILDSLSAALTRRNKPPIRSVIIDNSGWDTENIPAGWIWEDIGNYYGAGAQKFNFRENQYDFILESGDSVGDSVRIVAFDPAHAAYKAIHLQSRLTSAKKGSGDNAYVYLPTEPMGEYRLRGTIPVNEKNFRVSASITDPGIVFSRFLSEEFSRAGMAIGDLGVSLSPRKFESYNNIYAHSSPAMDSIIYWFNKKSINLYGEALVKTFAYRQHGLGSTDSGIAIVKRFWKARGVDEHEINIHDGSGLSPLNRITTHAQVEILKYARKRPWFEDFLNSLPEYNRMTMKSGTINGVKGFCGYHRARNGREFIFSFLINNYNGSPSAIVAKMYKVLDLLK